MVFVFVFYRVDSKFNPTLKLLSPNSAHIQKECSIYHHREGANLERIMGQSNSCFKQILQTQFSTDTEQEEKMKTD